MINRYYIYKLYFVIKLFIIFTILSFMYFLLNVFLDPLDVFLDHLDLLISPIVVYNNSDLDKNLIIKESKKNLVFIVEYI